jgi:hypothetical protein
MDLSFPLTRFTSISHCGSQRNGRLEGVGFPTFGERARENPSSVFATMNEKCRDMEKLLPNRRRHPKNGWQIRLRLDFIVA